MWSSFGLEMQQPEDVARFIVHCIADSSLDGASLLVALGQATNIEVGLRETMDTWMGEENARESRTMEGAVKAKAVSFPSGGGSLWLAADLVIA